MRNRGFTLLEISIVLLIVALITAAILTGRTMVKQAELQGIIADKERYVGAIKLFREKYKELPGDFPKATSIWGAMLTCPPAAGTPAALATCNGNGDTYIGTNISLNEPQSSNAEPLLAWQHLSNSGMLTNAFTGTVTAAGLLEPGLNIADSSIKGAGFYVRYAANYPDTNLGFYPTHFGHILYFGVPVEESRLSTDTIMPISAAISSSDAEAVDFKGDDGRPSTGNIMSLNNDYENFPATCTTSVSADVAEYSVGTDISTTKGCSLIFKTGF